MKKFVLCMVLAVLCCGICAAQTGASYYVSALGNDDNDGLSEGKPLKSLSVALQEAQNGTIKKITVIGTLNETSDILSSRSKEGLGTVFVLLDFSNGKNTAEILITGKPGASGAERAILSAKGSQAGVLNIGNNVKLRFEHIEISGGEKKSNSSAGEGISVVRAENSTITLGPGTVVRDNQGPGIAATLGTSSCILDGGEIRENLDTGVMVMGGATFTMRDGVIKDNKSPSNGGGVAVLEGGIFTMSGGTITGNLAEGGGGGVLVRAKGRFDQTGGTVTGNTAKQGSNPDIYLEQDSPPSSSSPGAYRQPVKENVVEFAGSFGFDVRGLYPDPFSTGVLLQLGAEFNFSSMSAALLGEAAVGIGFPGFTETPFWELSYGGMGEFYFPGKKFGIGAGGGFFGDSILSFLSDGTKTPAHDSISTAYTRFGLIFKGTFKTTLYAQLYGTGGFGFGLQWGAHW